MRLLMITALALTGLAMPALADGDAVKGETVFKKCVACHAVGENAKNKVGPVLNDLIGRTAGTLDGYKYSAAMIEAGAGGLVWTDDTLADYLTAPKALVPGTKMAFAGLKEEQDIEDLIAYLATFSKAE